MELLEKEIIFHLLKSQTYFKRVIADLDKNLFKDKTNKNIFKLINLYYSKKNAYCNPETCKILLTKTGFSEKLKGKIIDYIDSIENKKVKVDLDILEEETRNWIQTTSVTDAIMESAEIIEKGDADLSFIPDKIREALKKGLTKKSGELHSDTSRLERAEEDQGDKIPFELSTLNHITRGGFERKTLNCFVASQGGGKTRMLADLAVQYKRMGFNVLVITLEISKKKYWQRIDANFSDVDIRHYFEEENQEKIKESLKNIPDSFGEIIVEEFPQRTVNKNHILKLVDDLKLQYGFEPDVIIIDYLNLLNSITLGGSSTDTYNLIKFVSEEIRGMAQEFNWCIISATQFNREGMRNAHDPKTTDTSESTALINTLDFFMSLYIDDELDELKQLKCTILKTRYADLFEFKPFYLGLEKFKMRHFDLSESGILKEAENRIKKNLNTKGTFSIA